MNKGKSGPNLQLLAFASQLLPAIIGVGSFMLLVRVVETEALGQFLLYMAAVVLFEMVKSGGLQSALVMRLAGAGRQQQQTTIGSAYWLGGIFSIAVSMVLVALYVSDIFANQPAIKVFCGWYAVLGLITLPLHIAEAKAVARQDLKFLLLLRIIQSTNSIVIAVYAALRGGSLKEYATLHIVFTTLLMMGVLFSGKTNLLHVRHKTVGEVKNLLGLIRYTLGTLAATNLLKSADTFLIGSFLGPKEVAAYAIPLKLTELFEIPLRSLSTTAFPQLAASNNDKDHRAFRAGFVQYISWAYMLYIPALLIAFIFAPFIVTIFGGEQYAYTAPVFRVFCLYGLLLPADRMTGISLDALQKPQKNLIKVICMAIVNIISDFIALQYFGVLEWVAFASVLNAATGALIGYRMLQNTNVLLPNNIRHECVDYCTSFVKKGLQRFSVKAA
ncbi:MAG: oligosaccharide flippase family protein [Chitinophagaceae bacterium]|nr:oligosaccharide flippase family protein [Chitinophagaceae bacterium]